MSTLYELSADLFEIEQILTEFEGEIPAGELGAAFEKYLDVTMGNVDEKLDNILALRSDLLARSAMRQAEADRLSALAKIDENAGERLKKRVEQFLIAHDIDKRQLRRFVVSIVGNGGVAPLILDTKFEKNPETLPEKFRKVKYSADNDAIRAALASDDEAIRAEAAKVATLGERGKGIRIK